MACAESKAGQAAGVECFGLGFGDEAEICVLAWGEGSLAVVDFGHGPAQSTDVDGGGRNFPCEAGMVEKGDDFLSFAHGEDGHEDGSTAFEGGANGGEEFFFKVGAILARDGGLSAAGCFHDQGIERAAGSLAREHKGLALEIKVAGVECAAFFGADFGKDRTEDMAGIMKDELQFGG